jgi:hypothetical protein
MNNECFDSYKCIIVTFATYDPVIRRFLALAYTAGDRVLEGASAKNTAGYRQDAIL